MKPILKICWAFAAFTLGHLAQAQSSPIASQLVAQRVETVAGKAVFKPAGDGKPGDILQYSVTYRNNGAALASRLLATVPVPVGTTLVAASAEPAQAMASTDGADFAPMPLTRLVRQPDGSLRKETVPLADYRALRWEVASLPAGASTAVSLRVRIDSPASAPAARQ